MTKHFLTGGHAVSNRWLTCFASEFPDEGAASATIFFVDASAPDTWGQTTWDNGVVNSCDTLHGPDDKPALCLLSDEGVVSISNRSGSWAEQIEGAGLIEESGRGYMNSILEVENVLYAAGDGGQLYRHNRGGWQSIIPEIDAEELQKKEQQLANLLSGQSDIAQEVETTRSRRDFLTIAPGKPSELLIGGAFGLIAAFGSTGYSETRITDGAQIVFVAQQNDGSVLAVGWKDASTIIYTGTIAEGFEELVRSRIPGNASSAAMINDQIFIGSKLGLFTLLDGEIRPFTPTVGPQLDGVSALDVQDGTLWVVGHYDVFQTDGKSTTLIPQPQ